MNETFLVVAFVPDFKTGELYFNGCTLVTLVLEPISMTLFLWHFLLLSNV